MTSTLTDRRYGVAEGLAMKAPVRVATTDAITLSGLQTIDGETTAEDDRVLVKNQADPVDNGIYVASSGNWARALDFDGRRDIVRGTIIHILDGTIAAGRNYRVSTSNPIVVGTSEIEFEQVYYTVALSDVLDVSETGCAVAISPLGALVSDVIVTSSARAIRRLTDTGGLITVETGYPHGYTTGDSVVVRIDAGMHAVTKRAHPAQDTWTVTVVDSDTFTLDSSVWVADSIFEGGHCYIAADLIDASPELYRLNKWLLDNGGGYLKLPMGGMYLQSGMVRIPSRVIAEGYGPGATFFFKADYEDMVTPFGAAIGNGPGTTQTNGGRNNIEKTIWQDFSVYGNRGKQPAAGYHSINFGTATDAAQLEITLFRIHSWGSAGYGIAWGQDVGRQRCMIKECIISFSDNDGMDFKNHLDDSSDINIVDTEVNYWAMGSRGTDIQEAQPLTTDSISTTNGTSVITMLRDDAGRNARPLETVTIFGATAVGGIDPNGSWLIRKQDADYYYLETGQTASGTATGGGGSAEFYCPHISPGDRAIDMRGPNWKLNNITCRGEMFGRNGVNQRGGLVNDPNGTGADYLFVNGLYIEDTGPAQLESENDSGQLRAGISLGAFSSVLTNIVIKTKGIGIQTQGIASDTKISNFIIEGARIGIDARGSDFTFSNGTIVDSIEKGVQVWGATISDEQQLEDDPFTSTLGSNVVTVTAEAHGQIIGDTVAFSGAESGNGIEIIRSNVGNYTIIAVPTADTFTISDGGDLATASGAFGGSSVNVFYGTTANTAYRTTFIGVKTKQTDANTAIGWSIGIPQVGPNGRAEDTKIIACHDEDSDTPYEDAGTNTLWGPANTGGLPVNIETLGIRRGINTQVDSFILALTDAGKLVEGNKGTGMNITVPPNTDVAFPIGTWVDIGQIGAGQVTIAPGSGVTLRSRNGLKLAGQYAGATIIQRAADEWVVTGDLVA
jgi:hypothetical protein